jgi:hypothetical protein
MQITKNNGSTVNLKYRRNIFMSTRIRDVNIYLISYYSYLESFSLVCKQDAYAKFRYHYM